MNGHGIFKWADGRIYEGDWNNDLRHGEGEMKWPNGRKYKGGWKDGVQHGNGILICIKDNAKEVVKEGKWDEGIRIE